MGEQMKDYQIRSDFADEIISGSSEEEAYSHQTHEGEHVRVSHVCIHRADNVLGKQPGDYISIEFDSLHEHEAREEVIESLRAIDGVVVAAGIRKEKEGFKVSLRSKARQISVGRIARRLNGGGHEMAAGCSISAPTIEEAEKILANNVEMELNEK